MAKSIHTPVRHVHLSLLLAVCMFTMAACDASSSRRVSRTADPALQTQAVRTVPPAGRTTSTATAAAAGAPAFSTVTSTPPVVPSPGPSPPPSVAVRYVPAEVPRFERTEADNPFGDRPCPRLPAGATCRYEWQVYRVRGGTTPELIYRTMRALRGLEPFAEGPVAVLRFESRPVGVDPSHEDERVIDHAVFANIAGATVSLSELVTGQGGLFPSPDGTRMVLTSVRAPAPGQPRGAPLGEIYLLDGAGRASKLDGFPNGASFVSWSPDGTAFLVDEQQGYDPPGAGYLVPTADGAATLISAQGIDRYTATWSPDGSRLAYVTGGAGSAGHELRLFERTTGMSRRITAAAANPTSGPVWSSDGAKIVVGSDLIDIATDQLLASGLSRIEPWDGTLPPQARYLVMEQPPSGREPEPCDSDTKPTYLYDRRTGATHLLEDCGHGYLSRLQWLPDGRHLLLQGFPHAQREGVDYSETLIDALSGQRLALTDGLETNAQAYPSPSGDRVLVTGKSLRIYALDGRLLRRIAAPDGFDVDVAAWSPDGSSFIYAAGPAGFFVYP